MKDLSAYSLDQKIGQMIIVGFDGTHIDENSSIVSKIKKQQLGGVILFDYYPDGRVKNITNPKQLLELTSALKKYAKTPLLISIDYEGGTVERLTTENGFEKTQSQYEVAQLSDINARKGFNKIATLLEQSGINLNFSPVVDLHNPENPIIGQRQRAFSPDPNIVYHFANIAIQAYNKHGILAAVKHFPGHGYSKYDSHLGMVDITTSWQHKELLPYKYLIARSKNLSKHTLIMTSHLVHHKLEPTGHPASLSYQIITQLLRKKMGFNGVVITDDLQMNAITDKFNLDETVISAINAGEDILLFGNSLTTCFQDPMEIIEIVKQAIFAKKIKVERIEESFRRIMGLKQNI